MNAAQEFLSQKKLANTAANGASSGKLAFITCHYVIDGLDKIMQRIE